MGYATVEYLDGQATRTIATWRNDRFGKSFYSGLWYWSQAEASYKQTSGTGQSGFTGFDNFCRKLGIKKRDIVRVDGWHDSPDRYDRAKLERATKRADEQWARDTA